MEDALAEEGEEAETPGVEVGGVVLGEPFGELVNAAQGSFEVVGDDVGELGEFLVDGAEVGGALFDALFEFGVELSDTGFGLLAFAVGANGAGEVGAGDEERVEAAGGVEVVRFGAAVEGHDTDDLAIVEEGQAEEVEVGGFGFGGALGVDGSGFGAGEGADGFEEVVGDGAVHGGGRGGRFGAWVFRIGLGWGRWRGGAGLEESAQGGGVIGGVDDFGDGSALAAGHSDQGLEHMLDVAGGVGIGDEAGLDVADGAYEFVTFAESAFGFLASGDIGEGDDDAEHLAVVVAGERAGVDGDPDGGLVGAEDTEDPIGEGLAGAEGDGGGEFLGGEGGAVEAEDVPAWVVEAAEGEFVGGDAEDFGYAVVVGEEGAVAVDEHDAFGEGADDGAVGFFALAEGFLDAAAFAGLEGHGDDVGEGAGDEFLFGFPMTRRAEVFEHDDPGDTATEADAGVEAGDGVGVGVGLGLGLVEFGESGVGEGVGGGDEAFAGEGADVEGEFFDAVFEGGIGAGVGAGGGDWRGAWAGVDGGELVEAAEEGGAFVEQPDADAVDADAAGGGFGDFAEGGGEVAAGDGFGAGEGEQFGVGGAEAFGAVAEGGVGLMAFDGDAGEGGGEAEEVEVARGGVSFRGEEGTEGAEGSAEGAEHGDDDDVSVRG